MTIQKRNYGGNMINYKEIIAQCMICPGLERCCAALENVIWTTHIQAPEYISCERFADLGEAIKMNVQNMIHEILIKNIKEN